VSRLEYRLATAILRVVGWLCSRLPVRDRVVLASPRTGTLEGNLLHLHREIRARRPDVPVVLLLEPYSYRFVGKLTYALRLLRGMYLLRTSRTFVIDNAYLPVHVAPHPPRTTVIQVWHAAGALKRFGLDTLRPPAEPERTFLHRHYDWVVTTGEASRSPWSRALRTPVERVLPLGTPRTDFFFDDEALAAARDGLVRRYPVLAGRRVITYAPTFRGRGGGKRSAPGLDARSLRRALAESDVLVLKSHPNLDRRWVDPAGFDLVVDPLDDMNELLAATEILVTDYSSSIFEYALLRRPLILLVSDLADYERDPGLYLDYRTEMIGRQVVDTTGVIEAIHDGRFDLDAYEPFIGRHLEAADGHASSRFVERFLAG
jgi:CDP-glycerol glycerophosphotransferase (TagB/SpsB family)